MTITEWLNEACAELVKADIESARLDAELILAHTIHKPRTYLHAHGEDRLDERHEDIANACLQLRIDRTPMAYIIGHRWFYGRQFKTTPAALIPRPESETMIDVLGTALQENLSLLPEKIRLVDVGTGTGCLGITAKLEWPDLDVTLIDTSVHALNLAKENAALLGADVHAIKGNLLGGYHLPVNIVLANLPYVDHAWDVSPETNAEPQIALYAADEGLALIHKLIVQASSSLEKGGHLLLESDPRQQEAIVTFAKKHNFKHLTTDGYITHFILA